MGRFDDARAAFQQALVVEPNQEDVKTTLDQLP
jgi:Flp pilus assembly protein TadD